MRKRRKVHEITEDMIRVINEFVRDGHVAVIHQADCMSSRGGLCHCEINVEVTAKGRAWAGKVVKVNFEMSRAEFSRKYGLTAHRTSEEVFARLLAVKNFLRKPKNDRVQ